MFCTEKGPILMGKERGHCSSTALNVALMWFRATDTAVRVFGEKGTTNRSGLSGRDLLASLVFNALNTEACMVLLACVVQQRGNHCMANGPEWGSFLFMACVLVPEVLRWDPVYLWRKKACAPC